jgi:hypothetical protein
MEGYNYLSLNSFVYLLLTGIYFDYPTLIKQIKPKIDDETQKHSTGSSYKFCHRPF